MSFLLQRTAGRNLTLTQVPRDVLRIGRGTNQDLRSENPAVALEHALLEHDAAGYLITDKGSITGTYVNGRPVETARLSKGDAIEIGDLRIDVQLADPAKPLFLRVSAVRIAAAIGGEEEAHDANVVATPGQRVIRAKKFDYANAYRLHRPWLTKLSITALLLIVALAVIGEVIRPERQRAFMPGGLSSAHARHPKVANDCAACHLPWQSVSSSKCMDCHPQQPHALHEASTPDCFTCHAEHRGATKLAAIGDETCTGCHADLSRHVKTPPAQRASLRFAGGRYDFASIARIDAFGERHPQFAYPPDPDTLRFNHRLHLAPNGVFSATGRREVLACTNCHALATAGGRSEPVAVDFEAHCQRCHKLTFDARFPTAEVPHGGDPGIVYGFVGGMTSGDSSLATRSPAEVRRILTSRNRTTLGGGVLNAEKVIKTKCKQCHDLEQRAGRLAVVAPVIRTQWLPGSKFTHGRHRTIGCESCHADARTSAATGDVLMPRRENCTGCHAGTGAAAQASSACLSCHEYHLRPQRPVQTSVLSASLARGSGGLGSGGRMLQGILLATIVILLLVVLVPVGIALFQRLRPAPPSPAPRDQKPTPPPPQAPTARMQAITTDKLPRQPAPDVPPIAPPPPPRPSALSPQPSSPKATIADNVPLPPQQESAHTGTEMVQWYGMLHCTSGPLEGQRYVVEDEGFYIGRDPALAKIVIPDSRISKRHLRIVPRDGRVWAIDEGSTNGTFLRNQRITEVQLKRGDTLVLGDNAATFVYQI